MCNNEELFRQLDLAEERACDRLKISISFVRSTVPERTEGGMNHETFISVKAHDVDLWMSVFEDLDLLNVTHNKGGEWDTLVLRFKSH